MKALVSTQVGGPNSLRLLEMPDPVPGPDELLVGVAACGVNFPDVLIIEDRYQFKPPRPFAPGSEIAGTVIAAGAAVSGWQPGDRMIGTLLGSGGMAERAVVKASASFYLPAQHDFIHGAAFLLTYATAMHALQDRGRLVSGETLMILGAAGGIGLAAIEVGRALGARVVAAVSSEEKADAARAAGANETLIYPRGPLDSEASRTLAKHFKDVLGPGGADVILDPIGGDYTEPALRSIAWRGRYLVVGFTAGMPRIAANLILIKGCDVVGVFQGADAERDPANNAANVARLFDWWDRGLIAPKVTAVYALADGAQAISRLAARGAVGKIVISVTEQESGRTVDVR